MVHLVLVHSLITSASAMWWKYFCEVVRIYLSLCQQARSHAAVVDGTVLCTFLCRFVGQVGRGSEQPALVEDGPCSLQGGWAGCDL